MLEELLNNRVGESVGRQAVAFKEIFDDSAERPCSIRAPEPLQFGITLEKLPGGYGAVSDRRDAGRSCFVHVALFTVQETDRGVNVEVLRETPVLKRSVGFC